MADKKRKYGTICKGMKLTVVVEETSKDALVVILEHGSKIFRGVLLNATKRRLPPGICSAFNDPGGSESEEPGGNSQWPQSESSAGGEVEMSATVFRHTYNQNLVQFGTQFQGPPERTFRKLGSNRPARNIRLRPRQTLCSKCKSACLQSEKGPIPVNTQGKGNSNQSSTFNSRQQLVLPPSPEKLSPSKREIKKRSFSQLPDTRPKPTKLIKVNHNARLAKTSPFIKISIGETNVVNIPPRIHESDKEEHSSEERLTDLEDNSIHIESHLGQENDEEGKDRDRDLPHHYRKSLRKPQTRKIVEEIKNTSHRKHKKSRHKPKEFDISDGSSPTSIIITENIDSEDNEDKNENSQPHQIELVRPRLLYTWRQNKGLSPRPDSSSLSPLSPHSSQPDDNHIVVTTNGKNSETQISARKEYKLRSRSRSLDSNPEYEITEDSAYVSYEDPKSVSDRSEGCSTEMDTSSDTDSSDYGDGPPGDDNLDTLRPLLMKIHTNTVSKCVTPDGRKLQIGDIVWGKIKGFPWWPARVLSIAVSQKDNGVVLRQIAHIAWFGSSTMSHIQCSDLYLFLEDFKLRYKRKKRGPYKIAIKQATIAAQAIGSADNNEECDLS